MAKKKQASSTEDKSVKLTAKQQLFINFYLMCWNATQAAISAGYSAKTAYAIGAENLRKPQISEEIDRRLKAMKMSADKALFRLSQHADGTLAHFLKPNGEIDLDTDEARAHLHLLKKTKRQVKPDGTTTIEIEIHDPQTALVHIGRHHGVFLDKQEHRWEEKQLREIMELSDEKLRRIAAGTE